MVSSACSSEAIRLGFAQSDAGRQVISLHHQLQGRLRRTPEARGPEGEREKGHADATHRGTLKWYLEDDTGLVHVIMIQGAYLIPEASTRILSPQHLAQQANDHYPKEEGMGSLTISKNITLFWSQR